VGDETTESGLVQDLTHRAAPRTRARHRKTPLSSTEPQAAPVLTFAGVTAHAPGGRRLLDDVSFAVQRGSMVAVVGPTGAGKTSLARALTGALALRSGAIHLDGVDLAEDPSRRRRIAYVPQGDVLHGSLPLARTVDYAASLRVPRGTRRAERVQLVESALAELGLEHHAGNAVDTLSGGQRKRANIAAELVSGPDVIVLDEPTSGLDPGYEKSVLSRLRRLADSGRTVIAITHSTAAIRQCDRVLYLATGGRVAYFGPPSGASEYFGDSDTAEVFLALDEADEATDWKHRFRSHPAYNRYVRPILDGHPSVTTESAAVDPVGSRWTTQFLTVVRRQIDLLRSDRRHLGLLLLQGPLLGLLLRLVLAPDSLRTVPGTTRVFPRAETAAAFVALSATWLGASNAVREIVKERHIVRREVDAGLAPSAYVCAKALVLGLLTVVQTAVLATIALSAQSLPALGAVHGSRIELAVAGALVGLAAMCLGLILSSVVTTPDRALALLPMVLVTELALAGAWAADLTTPVLQWLRTLTGARWGVEAIIATVSGSRSAWLTAAVALGLLAASSLATAVVLVRHQNRPAVVRGLGHRAGLAAGALRQRTDLVLGGAAACCIVVAIGAVVVASVTGPSSPTAPLLAAPSLPSVDVVTAEVPVVPDTTAPPVTEAAAVTPAAPPTTVTTAAPPTTAAPTTAAPTTTTTFYVPPPTPTTVLPTPGVQATSASANPWMDWIALWVAMDQFGRTAGG
jgi:ABC-type multidrug transport system ATPase subunit